MEPRTSKLRRVAAVAALLCFGFFLQAYFLRSYPQPILFGDPGAYYIVGQKLQQAVARLGSGEDLTTVFESVRGFLYFAGVGSVYGLIDALLPQDIPAFRVVLSAFNTLTMLGVFFLAKRLSGSFAGGLLALALAAIYPPFSVQTGRLFPDPVTGCLFVWSAYFYVRGVRDESRGSMFASGLTLTAGLFVRSQLIDYVLVLLLLALAASARWWWGTHRKLAGALVLGALPFTMLWLGIVHVVGDDLGEIEAFGNFTFQKRYPYGFWQFLETDGWMGPYRLGQEPYYEALEAAAGNDPGLLESTPRQLWFTGGYVASRARESALLVLDNVYRLYDRPANDYKCDYPFPYSAQVAYQKILIVAAVAGITVLLSQQPSLAFAFFVPGCLALLHGLSYPWLRFNVPAMPILIAGAGAFAVWAFSNRPATMKWVAAAVALAGASAALGTFFRMPAPETAHALRSAASLALLALPFVWAGAIPRGLAVSGWLFLATLTVVHDRRSPAWHETSVALGEAHQEISLSREALVRLANATETLLVLDLEIPDGNPSGVRVSLNGRALAPEALVPTMPRFGESTAAGGRNRREYRQWWAIPLKPDDLPSSAPAVLKVDVEARERGDVRLYGDRFRDQERAYEGPSFGDWPHLAQVKLEYDGDYRLPVRLPLRSAGTRSDRKSVHRIRVISLANNEGRLLWETEPISSAGPVAAAFFAYTGRRGRAALLVEGEPVLSFPLGSDEDFEIEAPPYRLCHRAAPPRAGMPYGGYVLTMSEAPRREGPIALGARFLSGMSVEPMFVSLDMRRTDAKALAELTARCGVGQEHRVVGAGRIVEAETNSYPADTGRWSVADVF